MEVSWGFLTVLILVLFPGLIFRRLYFYGEFSKQFGAGLSLIKLISVSSIPGLIILACIYFFYDKYVTSVDIDTIIYTLKNVSNPDYNPTNTNLPVAKSLKDTLKENVLPFIGFLYLSSILIGLLSGRFVRITRIDTKFKLLRFKNKWFYLFNGEHTRFKKMRHLKEENRKHLFTEADILIDSNNKTLLYSGVIVDYELVDGDCQTLNNIMLQHAERYSLINDKKVAVKIPGNLLVVDCSKMKNINLTFVYEKTTKFLESRVPALVDNLFSLIIVLIIPFFIFQTDKISWCLYLDYFNAPWYKKIVVYLLVSQIITFLNPFVKNKEKEAYEYISFKMGVAKVVWLIVLYFITVNI